MGKQKSMTVWFAINKSGFVSLFAEEPKRNEETGKWDSKFPFVNSLVYDQVVALVEKAGLKWESEPECININFE